MKRLFTALLPLVLASATFSQETSTAKLTAPTDKQALQLISAYVRPLESADELSGALLVVRGKRVVYEKAWGMADYELDVPNTLSTKHCVASLTKPLTMILAEHLIADGKISETDKISKWIPDYPKGEAFTVGDLLSHRAGIPHRVIPEEEQTKPYTPEDMAKLAAKAGFSFEPGTQSGYSSGGYALLARVLELAGGKPFNQLMDEVVFQPAGATNTVAAADRVTVVTGRAYSYEAIRPRMLTPFRDLSFLVGAGSAYSSPGDLNKIIQRLLAGGYTAAARKRLLTENGFQWNGVTNGYRAFADYDAKTDTLFLFVSNIFTGASDLLRRDLPKIMRGESVTAPVVRSPKAVAMDETQRREIGGRYKIGPAAEVALRFNSDGSIAHYGDWWLVPTGKDLFFSPQTYQDVKIERSPDGKVIAIAWTVGPRFEKLP